MAGTTDLSLPGSRAGSTCWARCDWAEVAGPPRLPEDAAACVAGRGRGYGPAAAPGRGGDPFDDLACATVGVQVGITAGVEYTVVNYLQAMIRVSSRSVSCPLLLLGANACW